VATSASHCPDNIILLTERGVGLSHLFAGLEPVLTMAKSVSALPGKICTVFSLVQELSITKVLIAVPSSCVALQYKGASSCFNQRLPNPTAVQEPHTDRTGIVI